MKADYIYSIGATVNLAVCLAFGAFFARWMPDSDKPGRLSRTELALILATLGMLHGLVARVDAIRDAMKDRPPAATATVGTISRPAASPSPTAP